MKRLLLSIFFVAGLAVATVSLSTADNGPHGGFNTPTTDSCAGCHRAHTASERKLLMTGTADLCESCHGSAATGADTNVWDGVYLERDPVAESPAEGVGSRGLKGGGFLNAIMDTGMGGSATSAPTTSAHTFDGSSATLWGNGSVGSGPGPIIAMDCGNCHNPHGNSGPGGSPTYRILRPEPGGSGTTSGITISDPASKNYTIDDPNGNYWGQSYSGLESSIAMWCSQCHTRYLASSGSEDTSSGDPMFNFRHRSDGSSGVSCIDCHVAHGGTAHMDTNSGSVPLPDGSTEANGNARSSLLRLDNRGICVQCHENP